MADSTASAIRDTFTSPNVPDSNFEPANLVDVVAGLGHSARAIAHAISANAAPGRDAAGGHVDSLTEAVMGVTAGLCRIADSIDGLAAAVHQHGGRDE